MPGVALAQPWRRYEDHHSDLAASSSSPTSASLPISCVSSLSSYYSSSACPAPSKPSCLPLACRHPLYPNAHQGTQGVICVSSSGSGEGAGGVSKPVDTSTAYTHATYTRRLASLCAAATSITLAADNIAQSRKLLTSDIPFQLYNTASRKKEPFKTGTSLSPPVFFLSTCPSLLSLFTR